MPLSITCPGCRDSLDVDDEYRTWRVRCPRCRTEFVPDEDRPARADAVVARRDRNDEDDEEDDRPQRRRRRFTRAVYDRAAAEAYGPGMLLEAVGWLGSFGTAGLAFLFVVVGLAPQPGQQIQRPEDVIAAFLIAGCVSVLGLGLHVPMIIGGRHLRRLSSRTWVMIAAVLALLAMGLLHLPAGVWAIVVVNRPHVKAAFDYHARYGGPPDNDDD